MIDEKKEEQNKQVWKKALKEIYDLSRKDKSFRELALKDAPAAFEKVVGEAPPKDINISFVEGKKEREPVVLVLPELESKLEITDDELENVTLNFGRPTELREKPAAAYHNWGSERVAYHNWGSERVAYHNWGSE
ncbi:MAG: hypothetical protein OXE99_07640 [Cellvibrionales bacterium]|nr:hypothetical protein [Cellvibrionales bacterium]